MHEDDDGGGVPAPLQGSNTPTSSQAMRLPACLLRTSERVVRLALARISNPPTSFASACARLQRCRQATSNYMRVHVYFRKWMLQEVDALATATRCLSTPARHN